MRHTWLSLPGTILWIFAAATHSQAAGGMPGPGALALSADGATLFAALEQAHAIAVIDLQAGAAVREIDVPGAPTGLAVVAADLVAVTCGVEQGQLLFIRPDTGEVVRQVEVGHGPRAPVVSADGRVVYVCNQFPATITVVEIASGAIERRIPVLREPFDAALSPDGKTLVVVNLLSVDRADQGSSAAAVSLIDIATGAVDSVRLPNGSTSVRGVCVTPDGQRALAVHVLARAGLPTSQVERGWMNTNALSVIDLPSGRWAATVLLDEIDRGAANPWDVAVSGSGQWIAVSHAGTHELSLIDAPALWTRLEQYAAARTQAEAAASDPLVVPAGPVPAPENDLAFLVGLRSRVPLEPVATRWLRQGPSPDEPPRKGPQGLAMAQDRVYAAVHYGGAIAEFPLDPSATGPSRYWLVGEPATTLPLVAQGELNFHDGTLGFQGWQSCASCHPDGRADGLNWDLLNDGMGNPKNAKSLLLAHQTPPAMISGVRADAHTAVRTGFRYILFAEPAEADASAIDAYLEAMKPVPSPFLVDGGLSPAARQGEALFHSERLRCDACHPGPLFTDLQMHNVGSSNPVDRSHDFDTPSLVELWRTAPYMHDGQYTSIRELFERGKHGKGRGEIESLTAEELDQLIAYLQSL